VPTLDQIASQLTKLAPPGALATNATSVLRKIWTGAADEIVRIYNRIRDLLLEAHPLTCNETLTDWERDYDLPDPCITTAQTESDRRAAVAARRAAVGGASRQYFFDLAASFGIAITITEDRAFEVGRDGMGDGIGGDGYAFVWYVHAPVATSTALKQLLECVFERVKPAHTDVIFYYE
jgi:uncharacterized protein YmfQ (DUF2313 family)